MSRLVALCSTAALLVLAPALAPLRAQHRGLTLAVTMSNDPVSNQIKVYDSSTGVLLQTLSTNGQGGQGVNARGVKQYKGELFAAVNAGSNTVALFKRDGDSLTFDKLVTTSSAPVSVDFGNDHMYVAGSTTVDSFVLHHDNVDSIDGTAALELATGGAPPDGSTEQVGVVDGRSILVTLQADPDPGTVDIVTLRDGAVNGAPTPVSGPAGSLTPFGFSVYPDGTAVITLAHSNQDGLFRDGAFTAVVGAAQQAGPCWMTRVGKYLFTVNTGSHTVTRLIGTGNNIFVDSPVAASITTGANPTDLDADNGVLGVIDHGAGQSHLSLFTYNTFGELTVSGNPIIVGVANASGVAIMAPAQAAQ